MPRSRSTGSRPSRPKRAKASPAVVRFAEAVGASARSWDDAVTDAVRNAKHDAPDPFAVEVAKLWADVDGRSRISRYHAAVKVAHRQPLSPPAARRSSTRKS